MLFSNPNFKLINMRKEMNSTTVNFIVWYRSVIDIVNTYFHNEFVCLKTRVIKEKPQASPWAVWHWKVTFEFTSFIFDVHRITGFLWELNKLINYRQTGWIRTEVLSGVPKKCLHPIKSLVLSQKKGELQVIILSLFSGTRTNFSWDIGTFPGHPT